MTTTVFERPKSIRKDYSFPFCPGCSHGVSLRLVAEVIDELGRGEDTIAVASVGCSITLEKFYNFDVVGSSHGRAPCVATGVKRSLPENLVFTYQGDGDAVTIGFNETIHTASRGENLTVICINNTNFGMTGGQASATSLVGQITTTTPKGREPELFGYPVHVAETIALCDGAAFVARVSLSTPAEIKKAKAAIKRAFEVQVNRQGLGFVEILSTCPTNWRLSPVESNRHVKENMEKAYKLGIFKDIENEEKKQDER